MFEHVVQLLQVSVFGVPDDEARLRMVCKLDLETGIEGDALGYRHDIVLAGARSTPFGR